VEWLRLLQSTIFPKRVLGGSVHPTRKDDQGEGGMMNNEIQELVRKWKTNQDEGDRLFDVRGKRSDARFAYFKADEAARHAMRLLEIGQKQNENEPMTGHMWTQMGNQGDAAVGLFRDHGCHSDEYAYRQGWKLIPVIEIEDLSIESQALIAVWDMWTKGGELSVAVKLVKEALNIQAQNRKEIQPPTPLK
jgi:hypothetical protein